MYMYVGVLIAILLIAAIVYFFWQSAAAESGSRPVSTSRTTVAGASQAQDRLDRAATSGAEPAADRPERRPGVQRPPFARRVRPAADEEIEYRTYTRPRSEQRWDPFAEEQSRVHRVRAARHRPSTLPDYYKLLGLERGATDEQVERAYRRCASQIHPDRYHQDAEGRAVAEAQLKELNRAMEVLRDPTRRAQYDALL